MMRFPALYIAAVIITANTGLLVASNTYGLTSRSALLVLQVVLWLAACAYVATLLDRVSDSSDADEVASGTVALIACSAPLARIVWITQRGDTATWSLVLAGIAALLLLGSFLSDDASGLEWLAGIWATVTSLLQAGQFDVLPYARGALHQIRTLHVALDLRIATTALFAAILFVKATIAAVERGQPEIDDLPLFRIPPPEPDWPPVLTAVILPFLVIGDALFRAFQAVVNLLWKLAATVAVFFYRIGEEIVETIDALFSSTRLLGAILKTLGTMLGSLLTIMLLFRAARSLPAYIRSERLLGQVMPLVEALYFLLLAWLVATCVCWILGKRREPEELWLTAPFVVSNFIAIVFIAGIVLFALARIDRLALNGFRSVGLFSGILILLVGVGIPAWITRRSARKAQRTRTRGAA
jgi:hypothetical protein